MQEHDLLVDHNNSQGGSSRQVQWSKWAMQLWCWKIRYFGVSKRLAENEKCTHVVVADVSVLETVALSVDVGMSGMSIRVVSDALNVVDDRLESEEDISVGEDMVDVSVVEVGETSVVVDSDEVDVVSVVGSTVDSVAMSVVSVALVDSVVIVVVSVVEATSVSEAVAVVSTTSTSSQAVIRKPAPHCSVRFPLQGMLQSSRGAGPLSPWISWEHQHSAEY